MSQRKTEQFIEEQQKVSQFIRSLEDELKELQRTQRAEGWAQRNSVISHVYSGYREHEKVLEQKNKWERVTLECNVVKGLLQILLPHRNIYGFYDIQRMKKELTELLQLAEKKDEFELADSINVYRIRFIELI